MRHHLTPGLTENRNPKKWQYWCCGRYKTIIKRKKAKKYSHEQAFVSEISLKKYILKMGHMNIIAYNSISHTGVTDLQ